MKLKSGTLLHGGTYKIEKELGQGSFGITYLAVHTNLDKKVAIKEFFMKELNSRNEDGSITGMSDGSLSYDYCQKFQKEALNLSRLDHPNIVRVTDSFEDNGTFYYVMDYIEGMNLNEYIKQYSPSEKKAIEIIRSVAEALIYMHEQKHMLHLDLKPGNIMRRKGDGHIILIDFGLSKHYSTDGQPETSTTIGLGTAGYAPVEQGNRAKNGEFRPTIDVYALGATLYKLVTHETPPVASDLIDEDALPELLKSKGVSEKLSSVIINAMMPSVKKRISSVRAFVEQLPNSGYTSNASTSTSTVMKNEETIVAKESDEKTKLINNTPKPVSHPNFTEASYAIEQKYLNYPTSTKTKAEDGDLDAIIAYGIMLLRGQGVPQDTDAAYSWFMIAKDKGDDRASKILSQWYMLKDKAQVERKVSEKAERKGMEEERARLVAQKSGSWNMWLLVFLTFVVITGIIIGVISKEENSATDISMQNVENVSFNNGVLNVNGVIYDMVKVQAGTFTMGATPEMKGLSDSEIPAHQVTLTNDYYIGKTEVTQVLWKAVMGDNPSHTVGDNNPVDNVSWHDCNKFLRKLNTMTGKEFRLPTEAEWEFAARGGNYSNHYRYSGSNKIEDVAWYYNNSDDISHEVAQKKSNELGIFDMTGNAAEWCSDYLDWPSKYNDYAQINPKGPNRGKNHVCRGGNSYSTDGECTSANRCSRGPNDRGWCLGFRLVLTK